VDDWGLLAKQSPLANVNGSLFFQGASQSPLARTDWSSYFSDPTSSTGWWSDIPQNFGYGADNGFGQGFDYDPGSAGDMYSPASSMTNMMIDQDIDSFLRREHPELYDFTTGMPTNSGANVGNVAVAPWFGQFSKSPGVDAEIQQAASRYGVPANFLKVIIAKESSGDWDSNNRVSYIRPGSGPLLPYIGVFEDAAVSRGFGDLFARAQGNRAAQIDLLAGILRSQYDQLRKMDPSYGWLNVASFHYSGKPVPDGWEDEGGNGTNNQYVAQVEDWWKQLDAEVGNTWSNYTDTNQNTGIGSPQKPEWEPYAKWDEAIVGLNVHSGAPANLLKSFLRYGDENGLGYSNSFDEKFALDVDVLASNYRTSGDWMTAIGMTLGVPVTDPRVARIKSYWDELNADASGMFGGAPGQQMPSSQIEAIWGGGNYGLTQEFGPTPYSQGEGAWQYTYSWGLGVPSGHPGVDYGMPIGTKLYVPVSGVVITTGGSGYFYNDEASKYQNGTGELRIRLDNGDELILGHMSNIALKVGDRVSPGMFAGLSGYPDGPHVHVEYRTPSKTTSSGWQALDPRTALGGAFTGYHQGARTGLGYTTPLTFKNLMRAGASGEPIPTSGIYAQGGGNSSWTTWLRNTMLGNSQQQGVRAGQIDYSALYGRPAGTP
jgi:murein DD-endopeptidase MepM/ murein hydrolase activator NlpD